MGHFTEFPQPGIPVFLGKEFQRLFGMAVHMLFRCLAGLAVTGLGIDTENVILWHLQDDRFGVMHLGHGLLGTDFPVPLQNRHVAVIAHVFLLIFSDKAAGCERA